MAQACICGSVRQPSFSQVRFSQAAVAQSRGHGSARQSRINNCMSIYFPYVAHPWHDVADTFDAISQLMIELRDQNMDIIVVGDFHLSLEIGRRRQYINERCS